MTHSWMNEIMSLTPKKNSWIGFLMKWKSSCWFLSWKKKVMRKVWQKAKTRSWTETTRPNAGITFSSINHLPNIQQRCLFRSELFWGFSQTINYLERRKKPIQRERKLAHYQLIFASWKFQQKVVTFGPEEAEHCQLMSYEVDKKSSSWRDENWNKLM